MGDAHGPNLPGARIRLGAAGGPGRPISGGWIDTEFGRRAAGPGYAQGPETGAEGFAAEGRAQRVRGRPEKSLSPLRPVRLRRSGDRWLVSILPQLRQRLRGQGLLARGVLSTAPAKN